MMSNGEMLLAAILNDPGDDLARLAYADWCEEEGDDARAEFIRCQINLYPREGTLEILQRTGKGWSRWLPGGARYRLWSNKEQTGKIQPEEIGVRFHRGFVEATCSRLRPWLDHGRAIVQSHPVTRVEAIDHKPIQEHISNDKVMWRLSIHMPETLVEILLRDLRRSRFHNALRFGTEDDANAALSRALLILAHGTCKTCQGNGTFFRERAAPGWTRIRRPLGEWVECEACWWAKVNPAEPG